MGDKVLLTVQERDIVGKKVAKLRKEGYIPGIVYGHNFTATPVMAERTAIEKVYREAGKHHPVQLTVGDKKRLAMIKATERDPVKRTIRHISFHVVKQNEKVETEVPLRIRGEGETEAEKAGLVVLKAIEVVQVSALPNELPDSAEVPGEKLAAAGDHVTVADIIPQEGVAILTEPEIVVATVYEPSALAAQNDAAAGSATDESEVEAENGAEGASEDEEPTGKVEKEKE